MISVQLKAQTNVDTTTLSSYAAKVCYTSSLPEMGQLISVKDRLFEPGHHTTIEHNHFSFALSGLSVSSVVFGLHLDAPYYNTDQRSGRFSKMYDQPDMAEVRQYLTKFYPNENVEAAIKFVQKGVDIYQNNIGPMTQLAEQVIREDRPLANDKYVEANGKKFAQEQLRMFMSQVMPTAMIMTVNTSALAALWRVAWSPEMREITNQMKNEVLRVEPDLNYMFDENKRQQTDWAPKMLFNQVQVDTQPTCTPLAVSLKGTTIPDMKDSVDILPFSPFAMDNNTTLIQTEVKMSCATMGQDQRHRSVHRSAPILTGAFYLPPLLDMAGLRSVAQDYMQSYVDLSKQISPAFMTTIAPYGAMVRYTKAAHLNALLHEQGKRLCWCAQEEIYELARQLRSYMKSKYPNIAEQLAPPCYAGKCREGVRFCGRQVNKAQVADYFVRRRV